MRDAAINLRAFPAQRDLIDHAANLLGKNRSDFMLEAACDKAQSVVLDQVFFSLDTDKFKQFTTNVRLAPLNWLLIARCLSHWSSTASPHANSSRKCSVSSGCGALSCKLGCKLMPSKEP